MSMIPGLRFYNRKSSNNAARIRMWIYARNLEDQIAFEEVTHEMQLVEDFRRINPQAKIPALGTPFPPGLLYESSVILEYLEEAYQRDFTGEGDSKEPPFIPRNLELRAVMNLIIRTHDVYIASPNSTQPGSSHTQGCMYLPTQGRRKINDADRASKLAELWKQLAILEGLIVGPFCCGAEVSLADFTLFPTLVYCEYFLPVVFGWREETLFEGKPKLRLLFHDKMIQLDYAQRVKKELLESIKLKPVADIAQMVQQTQGIYKWMYP